MSNLIVVANRYIGQAEDPTSGNNNDFRDEQFEKKIRDLGWRESQSWCAYFVMLVVKEAYPHKWAEIRQYLSPSVLTTLRLLTRSGGFELTQTPKIGSLVFWQSGTTAFGHIGIVSRVNDKKFLSIEGNTDISGSRDGGVVAQKERRLDFTKRTNGLWLRGFINIEDCLQ